EHQPRASPGRTGTARGRCSGSRGARGDLRRAVATAEARQEYYGNERRRVAAGCRDAHWRFSQAVLPNCDRRSGIITDGEFTRNGWPLPGSLEIAASSPNDWDGWASWGLSTAEEETRLDAMARTGVWGRRDRGAGDS